MRTGNQDKMEDKFLIIQNVKFEETVDVFNYLGVANRKYEKGKDS